MLSCCKKFWRYWRGRVGWLGEHRLLKKMFETTEVLVGLHRIAHNKKPQNKYIVCNQDEPYSEEVWKIILDGETKKEEGRG